MSDPVLTFPRFYLKTSVSSERALFGMILDGYITFNPLR